jgi:hypothetical protein
MSSRPATEPHKGTDDPEKTLPQRLKRRLHILLGVAFIALGLAFIALGVAFIALGVASTALGKVFTALGVAFIALGVAFIALGAASTTLAVAFMALGAASTAVGVVLILHFRDAAETLLQRIVTVLLIVLATLLVMLAASFIALSVRMISLVRDKTKKLPRDETDKLLALLQKSFEFLIALAVLWIGLFLLLDALKGRPVAAAFSRVGGPTRVETALEASRFWRTPQRVVTTSANAPQETMLVAADCAMRLDAPLLFTSPDENRQQPVNRMIDAWRTSAGPGDPPRFKPVEVPNGRDVTSCVHDGGPPHPLPDGLSTLEVSNRQLDLPGVEVREKLASVVVLAAAKAPREIPDVAVALALAAHMAREDGQVSLLVVPRFLEADPELKGQLRGRRELVAGGVVLGQTGVLPEDTRILLHQLLTSTDRPGILAELKTTLGSLTPLIAALLAFLGALMASKVGPDLAKATSNAAPDLERAISQRASDLEQAISQRASDLTEGGRRIMERVITTQRPRRTGLRSGQEVTVWLRSGWRVIGKVSHGKDGADVPAVAFLQLSAAKLARDEYESEQTAEMTLLPVEDIELIKLIKAEGQ